MRLTESTSRWVVHRDVQLWTEQFPAEGPTCLLLIVGTRWKVEVSSLENLWRGPYAATLRQVDDGGSERASG